MSSEWLDLSINSRLRERVNEGGICHFDEQFKAAHNSICIMMDRVDDSGRWLNDHAAFPDSVDEFLLFLVHADIVIKTVLSVLGKVGLENPFRGQNSKESRQLFATKLMPYMPTKAEFQFEIERARTRTNLRKRPAPKRLPMPKGGVA